MNKLKFEYDVAYSFLDEDELIAKAIDNFLKKEYKTFIYSKHQKKIVGTDGEKTLNQVFNKDSKIVVILYRKKWGSTPWTRVEETAIRNRALNEDYDFALLILLDSPPNIPDWYPKYRIWYDYNRFSIEGAAAIIKSKLDNSLKVKSEESAIDIAAKINNDITFSKKRIAFLESKEAVNLAVDLLKELFENIMSIFEIINKNNKHISITSEILGELDFEIKCHPYILSVSSQIHYSNSLRDSSLDCYIFQIHNNSVSNLLYKFTFDTLDCKSLIWYGPNFNKQIFSSALLADKITTDFLKKLQNFIKSRPIV
ncbi:MAG: hypothetical protein KAW92_08385 [Candidatus Cloacimonetes bacterium]|nr:hypothetical protein [Candidatus Cloacimonadota bacterium]